MARMWDRMVSKVSHRDFLRADGPKSGYPPRSLLRSFWMKSACGLSGRIERHGSQESLVSMNLDPRALAVEKQRHRRDVDPSDASKAPRRRMQNTNWRLKPASTKQKRTESEGVKMQHLLRMMI